MGRVRQDLPHPIRGQGVVDSPFLQPPPTRRRPLGRTGHTGSGSSTGSWTRLRCSQAPSYGRWTARSRCSGSSCCWPGSTDHRGSRTPLTTDSWSVRTTGASSPFSRDQPDPFPRTRRRGGTRGRGHGTGRTRGSSVPTCTHHTSHPTETCVVRKDTVGVVALTGYDVRRGGEGWHDRDPIRPRRGWSRNLPETRGFRNDREDRGSRRKIGYCSYSCSVTSSGSTGRTSPRRPPGGSLGGRSSTSIWNGVRSRRMGSSEASRVGVVRVAVGRV